jgi:hypothetical protein
MGHRGGHTGEQAWSTGGCTGEQAWGTGQGAQQAWGTEGGTQGSNTGEQAWGTGQGAQVRHIRGAHRHLNSGGDAAGDGVGVGMA